MSLTTNGVWAANVWASTVWGDCVWFEPHCAVEEPPTGGGKAWRGPEKPTKKEIEAERIRLGILPEPVVKPALKKAERLGEAEKPLELESITSAKEIGKEVERLKAKMFEAEERQADVDTLLWIHLALSAADARAREIEEQDIVFVMTMLMV
jgi:hypothetical protein